MFHFLSLFPPEVTTMDANFNHHACFIFTFHSVSSCIVALCAITKYFAHEFGAYGQELCPWMWFTRWWQDITATLQAVTHTWSKIVSAMKSFHFSIMQHPLGQQNYKVHRANIFGVHTRKTWTLFICAFPPNFKRMRWINFSWVNRRHPLRASPASKLSTSGIVN